MASVALRALLLGQLFTANGLTSASPIVERCPGLKNVTSIACVNNYAAVLPAPFKRASASNGMDPANDTFVDTSVPSDPSFTMLENTPFVVFDQARGLSIVGSETKLEKMFDTRNDSIHEAPVYVPGLNVIIYSLPHQGIYEQQVINLTNTPPTIANYTTTPPVYAVNGGKLYKNKIYWASEASFPFPDPTTGKTIQQYPGIYQLDPYTGNVTTLVNNYYGTQLNSPNDLFIDSVGDVFFTDSWYGYAINVTTYPVHAPATYRFRPSTGALSIVENTLQQPNGIGVSPDGSTMYITDTGITKFRGANPNILPRYTYNPFGGKSVYAFDIRQSPAGSYITNKRPIWLAETFAHDGFHVSREGYLLGAAGSGIGLLSQWGELIMRFEIGEVNNFQFAGPDASELWAFGPSGIWRVSGLKGLHGMVDDTSQRRQDIAHRRLSMERQVTLSLGARRYDMPETLNIGPKSTALPVSDVRHDQSLVVKLKFSNPGHIPTSSQESQKFGPRLLSGKAVNELVQQSNDLVEQTKSGMDKLAHGTKAANNLAEKRRVKILSLQKQLHEAKEHGSEAAGTAQGYEDELDSAEAEIARLENELQTSHRQALEYQDQLQGERARSEKLKRFAQELGAELGYMTEATYGKVGKKMDELRELAQ